MTTTTTPATLAELKEARRLLLRIAAERDAAWDAAVLRAAINSAWDADDTAYRDDDDDARDAAWDAAVLRAALEEE